MKVHNLSVPDIQINDGEVSAISRKRRSLSRNTCSRLFVLLDQDGQDDEGTVVASKNNCTSVTLAIGFVSLKGPSRWTSPQIAIMAMIVAEVLTPVDPKRRAAQSKNGTREYKSAGRGARLTSRKVGVTQRKGWPEQSGGFEVIAAWRADLGPYMSGPAQNGRSYGQETNASERETHPPADPTVSRQPIHANE